MENITKNQEVNSSQAAYEPKRYADINEVKVQAGKYARKEYPMVRKAFAALAPEIGDDAIMAFIVNDKVNVILASIAAAKSRNEIPSVEINYDADLAAKAFA